MCCEVHRQLFVKLPAGSLRPLGLNLISWDIEEHRLSGAMMLHAFMGLGSHFGILNKTKSDRCDCWICSSARDGLSMAVGPMSVVHSGPELQPFIG